MADVINEDLKARINRIIEESNRILNNIKIGICNLTDGFISVNGKSGITQFGFHLAGAIEYVDIVLKFMEDFAKRCDIEFERFDRRDTDKYGPECHICKSPYHWQEECRKCRNYTSFDLKVTPEQVPIVLHVMPNLSALKREIDSAESRVGKQTEEICNRWLMREFANDKIEWLNKKGDMLAPFDFIVMKNEKQYRIEATTASNLDNANYRIFVSNAQWKKSIEYGKYKYVFAIRHYTNSRTECLGFIEDIHEEIKQKRVVIQEHDDQDGYMLLIPIELDEDMPFCVGGPIEV